MSKEEFDIKAREQELMAMLAQRPDSVFIVYRDGDTYHTLEIDKKVLKEDPDAMMYARHKILED